MCAQSIRASNECITCRGAIEIIPLVSSRFRISNQSADCRGELVRRFSLAQKRVCSRAPRVLFAILRRQHDYRSATPMGNFPGARNQLRAAYSGKAVAENKNIVV